MFNWLTIESDYLTYLRSKESRIPYDNYGTDKLKPFFGVLFYVGDLAFVTQVTSSKARTAKLPRAIDFYKINK